MVGTERWFEVSFTKRELELLTLATERLGYNHGQIGTDIHERLQTAYAYAQSVRGTDGRDESD